MVKQWDIEFVFDRGRGMSNRVDDQGSHSNIILMFGAEFPIHNSIAVFVYYLIKTKKFRLAYFSWVNDVNTSP